MATGRFVVATPPGVEAYSMPQPGLHALQAAEAFSKLHSPGGVRWWDGRAKGVLPLTSKFTKFVILRISGRFKSYKYFSFKTITDGYRIANYDGMLRIRRFDDTGSTVVALSGRIEENDLPELQAILDAEPKAADLTLDLQEVRLVYREGVRFLATCKAMGIKLNNCPAYIRECLG